MQFRTINSSVFNVLTLTSEGPTKNPENKFTPSLFTCMLPAQVCIVKPNKFMIEIETTKTAEYT
jgi:hypothetical protein